MSNRQNGIKTLLLAGLLVGVTACSDTHDELLDHADKKNSAEITYINAADNATTFYLKSRQYLKSVYHRDFVTTNLPVGQVSRAIEHKWASSGHKSEFAIEDSTSGENMDELKYSLSDNDKYWAIAWMDNGNEVLSVFEKKASNQNDVMRVRVFANQALSLNILDDDANYPNTEAGKATPTYTLQNCSDLYVGGNEIDLCQQGNYGESYLVVVNQQGQISYAPE
ncbi:hypothetical protein [Psychrobium sp. 1_MG-2023]|uniref:hypothetical protein n=1 Tax=Psychrobium sp. 1_MG-2023 TaxID=3062624 RepID=UPI000C338FDA|nr:hypothetical protein [Psychrobium sp. 1_MG-2023]MDP2562296.1 hypothetical protein [Psychrobium sp. 1_MG-2023]PKF54679.1 hypothetical protein CW748_15590 [Alteromonadales bacterium alter-6D02]